MEEIRTERNRLLSATDKYALPDYPFASEAIRQQWLFYRQQLRTLPERIVVYEDGTLLVPWPIPPE